MRGNGRIIAIAVAIVICGALGLVLLGALGASIRRDLGLSNTDLGTVFTIFSAVSMTVARPAGGLCERLGWQRAATVACWLGATSFLGIAALGRNLPTLALFAGIGGLSQAMAAPSANLLVAREIGGPGSGTAMGLKQSAVPIASIMAGVFVPVFALTIGWRFAFLTSGVLAAGVPWLIVSSGREPTTSRSRVSRPAVPAVTPPTPPTRAARPSLLAMALAGFLGTSTAHAYNAFYVVSSVDRGISEGAAATVFATSGLVCLVVRVLGGVVSDRRPNVASLPLTGAAVLLAGGVLGVLMLAPGVLWLVVVGGLLTYGAGWAWPTFYHLAIVRYFAEAPARATGSLRIGLAGGAMAGPLAFGVLSSNTSYGVAWMFTAVVGMLGAGALWWNERQVRAIPPDRRWPEAKLRTPGAGRHDEPTEDRSQ